MEWNSSRNVTVNAAEGWIPPWNEKNATVLGLNRNEMWVIQLSYVNNVNNITNENPSIQEFIKIKHHNYSNMFRLHTVSQLPTSNNVSFDFPSFFTVLRHVKFIAY